MYRQTSSETVVAEDSNLEAITYERKVFIYQTKDNLTFTGRVRIAPSASQAGVAITPVTTGYYYKITSDYPIMFRINSSTGTQFTMHTNNVSATNVGSPAPHQCLAEGTVGVTEIYLQPISGATQTANVDVVVSGDPQNAYT